MVAQDKRLTKREKKLARKEQQEADKRAAEKMEVRRKTIMILVPVLTILITVGLYLYGNKSIAGMTLLAGFLVWLGVGLGAIGSSVPARDKSRGGSIDYGRRR